MKMYLILSKNILPFFVVVAKAFATSFHGKKSLYTQVSLTSADSFVRGASQFTLAGDVGGGGGVHLPSLHGGRGAGAFPLHPLLPARDAQVRRWHIPSPPRAPWHPCSKDRS